MCPVNPHSLLPTREARAPREARPQCPACHRVVALCLCARVRPFRALPRFALLIHPKEARRTIGTARIVKLGLPDTVVIPGTGASFDEDERLRSLLADPTLDPHLLFPGPAAKVLTPANFQPARRPLILVIDGTWPQAQKMLQTSALLRTLPCVKLSGVRRSGYEFRRQPAPHCLSTVEAVHQVIQELHAPSLGTPPEDVLLDAFHALVESQLLSAARGVATQAPC